jgi:hypothetical protein
VTVAALMGHRWLDTTAIYTQSAGSGRGGAEASRSGSIPGIDLETAELSGECLSIGGIGMDIEASTYYFERPGDHADRVLEVAKARALERDVKQVVVASTRGQTGVKAVEAFKGTGIDVVVVTHQTGHRGPGTQQLTDENRKRLQDLGVRVVTGTDAFEGGVGLGITRRQARGAARPPRETISMMSYLYPTIPPVARIVASVLRVFCQGVKVAVEVTLMAADAGAIPVDRDVVAIAGTGNGADTALLLRPANTTNFLDLDIHEIIAKPFTKARPTRGD